MEADDEGFVSPKRVMRLYGGNDDDLKVLKAKGFVIQFESGVVVITNWKENNYLDKNRIIETRYQAEKKLLALESNKYVMLNQCLTSVKPMLNQYRREENRREEEDTTPSPSKGELIKEIWNKYKTPPQGVRVLNKTAVQRLLPECRKWTQDLEKEYKALLKKGYTDQDIELSIKRYCTDIIGRAEQNGYASHRFSILEFIKQSNGMRNYINK
jgi:hypothetical protein